MNKCALPSGIRIIGRQLVPGARIDSSRTKCLKKLSGISGEVKEIIPDQGHPEKDPGNLVALLRRC